jgi:hypothetical protein
VKEILATLCLLFVFFGGYALGSIHSYVDKMTHCTTYTARNGVKWIGYRAISDDNDRRCFWLEDRFPNRVQQGVEVNK